MPNDPRPLRARAAAEATIDKDDGPARPLPPENPVQPPRPRGVIAFAPTILGAWMRAIGIAGDKAPACLCGHGA